MTPDAPIADVENLPASSDSSDSATRALVGYLALAAPALVLAADSAVAIARGWRVESRFDLAGLVALAVWLAATAALVIPRAGRRLVANKFAQLIALCVSVCGMLLFVELALGSFIAIGEPFHLRAAGTKLVYRPQAGAMRDVGPEARVSFNSWGVRGDEPPPRKSAYRILCLGGSSTACTYLDDAKTWPHLLQTELGVRGQSAADGRNHWVGNAGFPGFRIDEHRQFVEGSPLVDQLDCLLIQVGINDFMSCLMGPRPAPPLWTGSRVWQAARSVARRSLESGTLVEDSAGAVYPRRRAARQAAAIDPAAPALDECLDRFADNVRATIDACRRRNVRVVFTTQSVLWRTDLDPQSAALLWFGLMADGRYLSVEQLRAGMDRFNETLRRACGERGVDVVDLSELDGDPAMFYDDCHFTETGARRGAQILTDWFVAHPAASRPGAAQ